MKYFGEGNGQASIVLECEEEFISYFIYSLGLVANSRVVFGATIPSIT